MALDSQTRKTTADDRPAENGGDVSDEPTGYYVAGHDWPAIENAIEIDDMYAALRRIGESQVAAAGASLLDAGQKRGHASSR